MNVFISWSGDKSKAAANALRDWISDVFQTVNPWMSEVDIDAGSRWSDKISGALQDTNIGIICVTKQNLTSPWLLFEAGALAKSVNESYVIPYLLDIEPAEVPQGPLSQFQAKRADEKGTFELISTLNELLPENGLPPDKLKKTFDKWWGDLELVLSELPEDKDVDEEPTRELDDKVDEILDIVRELRRGPGRKSEPSKTGLAAMIRDEPDIKWTSSMNELIDNIKKLEHNIRKHGLPKE